MRVLYWNGYISCGTSVSFLNGCTLYGWTLLERLYVFRVLCALLRSVYLFGVHASCCNMCTLLECYLSLSLKIYRDGGKVALNRPKC